ncbi:MAG: Rieske (2Fe-2S) protein [Flavobacterium sp.]|uniref:Rieske (2Fe-2S) protein n=1 Tax=Flavobacterium sp. TaxID=239 RepID=UPI003BCE6617
MCKIFILLLVLPFAFGCDTGSVNNNNPNIPNYSVNLQINLSLPGYSNLQFASNHVVDYSQGARGIVVFNAGNNYVAFDLACPNQPYSTCTAPMTITGINATCSCDNSVYNLYTAQSPGQQYPLKQYRVDVNGGYLYVTN